MQICNVHTHVSLSLDGSCLQLAVCHWGLHLLTRKHGCWFSVCVCGWRGGQWTPYSKCRLRWVHCCFDAWSLSFSHVVAHCLYTITCNKMDKHWISRVPWKGLDRIRAEIADTWWFIFIEMNLLLTCGFLVVQKIAVKYGPLVIVLTIVGLFIYLLITPSKSAKRLNKKRR